MKIVGIDHVSPQLLEEELAQGGRLVVYEYCISLIIVTLRRPSDVHLVRARENRFFRGWRYTLVSLVLGWWGLPWGIIYTPLVLLTNLSGGRDVTAQVRAAWLRADEDTAWALPAET